MPLRKTLTSEHLVVDKFGFNRNRRFQEFIVNNFCALSC